MIGPIKKLFGWLWKSAPEGTTTDSSAGFGFIDAYKRHRAPTAKELLEELKNTAWVCASINASACASFPPGLYVSTKPKTQPLPKCLTAPVPRFKAQRIRDQHKLTKAHQIDEVLEHPLLTLLAQANPVHNSWDLWELTTLYQETVGTTYWLIVNNRLGVPGQIWPLASHIVKPVREIGSNNIVDYYEVKSGAKTIRYSPNEIIEFKYPDPRDPYGPGLSPLRAACEQVKLTSQYAAYRLAVFDNNALPSAIISPDEVIGEDERHRLEELWNQRFRRGGTGRVLVAESAMNVSILNHSLADLGALAEYGYTRQDIANAFCVPIAFLTAESNLANLQASESQHMKLAIRPRLTRRDEKLNEQLLPRFDPTKRLFLASEDPVPGNQDQSLKQDDLDLKWGVKSINDVREERGMEPAEWGNVPWLPLHMAPTDDHVARQQINAGDNSDSASSAAGAGGSNAY
jgi:HK97 family phage portal protein